MKELLKWWCDYKPLTKEEHDLIFTKRSEEEVYKSDDEFNELKKQFFDRMLFSNLTNDYHLTFDTCATNLINALFDNYVTDDTLVVTSNCEHDNVKKNINKSKNWLELNHYTDIRSYNIQKIIDESKKYKDVFIYIIGTQISSGEITPQQFYIDLKKALTDNHIKHTMVIDDVQGMFLVPRDYTLFDHVIGTCHSLVGGYDLGILVSKNNPFGKKVYNWGNDYLKCLDMYLNRKDKMNMFTTVMQEYYSHLLLRPNFHLLERTAPHIFSMRTSGIKFTQRMYDLVDAYEIRLEGITTPQPLIRFRAQHFIPNPESLLKGVDALDGLLKMILN